MKLKYTAAVEHIDKRLAEISKAKQGLAAEMNAVLGAEEELLNLKKILTEVKSDETANNGKPEQNA